MTATTLAFKQATDLNPALEDFGKGELSSEKLIGRWLNTNRETRGIAECSIAGRGDDLVVTISGVGASGLIEWPSARATMLANLEEEAGQRTVALAASFDLGFMSFETSIRVNKGVLVIVLFAIFKDESGRSNYLNREFFYRQD